MTLEDLQRAGILLPEEEWGQRSLETTAGKPALAAVGAVALAGVILMYAGAGGLPTWVGAGLYLVGLLAFTGLSLRAVDAQVERAGRTVPRTDDSTGTEV
jgi:hypothetical protein